MAKKSLLSSTSKKKTKGKKSGSAKPSKKKAAKAASKKKAAPKSSKKATKPVKSAAKAKAPKKAAAKKTAPKKAAPKKAAPKKAAAKKTVSIKELLFKKFDRATPETLYKAPIDTSKPDVTSPPFVSEGSPEEIDRIRKLLFKQFDLSTPDVKEEAPPEPEAKEEVPEEAPAEEAPPEPEAKEEVPEETPAEEAPPEPEAKEEVPEEDPAEEAPPEPEAKEEVPEETPAEEAPPEPEAKEEVPEEDPAEEAPPEPEAKEEVPEEAPAEEALPEPEAKEEVPEEAPAEEALPEPEAKEEVPEEAPAEEALPEPEAKEEVPAEKPAREKISINEVPLEKTLPLAEVATAPDSSLDEPRVQDIVTEDQGVGSMQKSFIAAGACFAAILILIIGISISNMNQFEIRDNNGTIEIWEGSFAPIGMKKMIALEGTSVADELLGITTKNDAYALIFNDYLKKADALMKMPGLPDYKAIRATLKDAKAYAITAELKTLVTARLNRIELTTLLYNADIAAGKGTLSDLKAAKSYLDEGARLKLAPTDKQLLNQKLEWVESKIANMNKSPAQLVTPATESNVRKAH